VTASMKEAIEETSRRRALQEEYNQEHGITPTTISKPVDDALASMCDADFLDIPRVEDDSDDEDMARFGSLEELDKEIVALEKQMKKAAEKLDFERAAGLRDRISYLRKHAVFG
jgi:excinuclease ABC subunit B